MMHAIVTDKCDGVSNAIGFQSVNAIEVENKQTIRELRGRKREREEEDDELAMHPTHE